MLKTLRNRVASVRGIADLCARAEAVARSDGETEPAAEHFLLASLEMPDGSAARALAELGHDRVTVAKAIQEHHAAALDAAGIPPEHVIEGAAVPDSPGASLYRVAASGQQLMQILSQQARERSPGSFRSIHVLEAAAAMRHGVVPRVLKTLGISETLKQFS